ncbi:MAG: InlB B-repeat-containing protein, partial [Bacteroidales bacterium]|nr:InlB B-repeat-containing protein [Bacteroidales bacterium]
FQVHYFQILVEALPVIGAKVSGSGAYSAQDTVTLTATPANGYAFIGWVCDGETLSHEPTYRFVPERDMLIVAQTKKLTASIRLSASPAEGGTMTGAGDYRLGETVTLTATPNAGFMFLQWVDDRMNTVSTQSTFSFTADQDVHYTAMFGSISVADDEPVHLYPVPFGDEVHLEGESIKKIVWFNPFGTKIAQYEINSLSNTVMTTYGWPKGLYVYYVIRNSGKITKGKALKL